MRDQWYSDHRDLVKWATLLHVAQTHGIGTIIQVACYRPDVFAQHKLSVDGTKVDIPGTVWEHFRSVHAIQGLAARAGVAIHVLDDLYCQPRHAYYVRVTERLSQPREHPWLVFLDPDTGIEPGNANLNHVREDEVGQVFAAMRPGDALVFYQHARHTATWQDDTRAQFARAIERADGIQTFACPSLAGDVAFFVVTK